eukprot:3723600-Pleurochrysis_carterae.AAC.1
MDNCQIPRMGGLNNSHVIGPYPLYRICSLSANYLSANYLRTYAACAFLPDVSSGFQYGLSGSCKAHAPILDYTVCQLLFKIIPDLHASARPRYKARTHAIARHPRPTAALRAHVPSRDSRARSPACAHAFTMKFHAGREEQSEQSATPHTVLRL